MDRARPFLELFAGEDQALLVRRDSLLVLDLRFDVVDDVGRLDLKGLHKDMPHAEMEDKVQRQLLLNFVAGETILELLDVVDGVGGLNLERDRLAGEGEVSTPSGCCSRRGCTRP